MGYSDIVPMTSIPLESDRNAIIHYTVFPNMKVTRNMYAGGRRIECVEAGEYIYFESDEKYFYVNYEKCRSQFAINCVTSNYLPKLESFRAHTPVFGPWPEKCRDDYLFKYRNLLLQKLKYLEEERSDKNEEKQME